MNQKINVGRIIEGVFETYRDNAAVLLPVAAVVFLIEAIISGVLVEIAGILLIVAIMVQWAATYLFQGTVVSLVHDLQDGRRDFSVEQLIKSVAPVLLTLIVAGLLASIAITLGLILVIVPGLFLATIWAVVAPVIVVERKGVLEAFGRSRELVRGNGWQVLAVILIFFLILLVVGFVFGIIGAIAGGVGRVILEFIGSVIAAPLIALAASILYFNLRAAKGEAAAPGGRLDATGGAGQVAAPSPAGQPAPPAQPQPSPQQPNQPSREERPQQQPNQPPRQDPPPPQ